MPRINCQPRRIPREQDPGYHSRLFGLARERGLFIERPQAQGQPWRVLRGGQPQYAGTAAEVERWLMRPVRAT